jgi:hypothetical protein
MVYLIIGPLLICSKDGAPVMANPSSDDSQPNPLLATKLYISPTLSDPSASLGPGLAAYPRLPSGCSRLTERLNK